MSYEHCRGRNRGVARRVRRVETSTSLPQLAGIEQGHLEALLSPLSKAMVAFDQGATAKFGPDYRNSPGYQAAVRAQAKRHGFSKGMLKFGRTIVKPLGLTAAAIGTGLIAHGIITKGAGFFTGKPKSLLPLAALKRAGKFDFPGTLLPRGTPRTTPPFAEVGPMAPDLPATTEGPYIPSGPSVSSQPSIPGDTGSIPFGGGGGGGGGGELPEGAYGPPEPKPQSGTGLLIIGGLVLVGLVLSMGKGKKQATAAGRA